MSSAAARSMGGEVKRVLCGLTFELRRDRRQDARPRPQKMHTVPVAGALWLAVGPRLERRVRPHTLCQPPLWPRTVASALVLSELARWTVLKLCLQTRHWKYPLPSVCNRESFADES